MGKVHDQIKAVLGAWGEWTSLCPCTCEHCLHLDEKLAFLVPVLSRKTHSPDAPPLNKRVRPAVVLKSVLKAFKTWNEQCHIYHNGEDECVYCRNLLLHLTDLMCLIEAGPEEEKKA